jgi:hypothetical protein
MKHEAQLQIDVVKYLKWMLPPDATFWATLNERKTKSGDYLNRMGRRAGVSDLLVLYKQRLHCIELKVCKDLARGVASTTYPTAVQREFQSDVERAGAFYAVCRSVDDVRGMLTAWGVPLREKQ